MDFFNIKYSGLFFILFFGLLLQSKTASAQVAGVSASKLTAIDAILVPTGHLEAEPSFIYLYGKKAFGNNGRLYPATADADSAVILRNFFFRFTYGVSPRLEIGTYVTANLSSLSFGAKYRFLQHKKFLAVALVGFNFSDSPDWNVRKTGFFGKAMGIASGVGLTSIFSPRFSLDISAQYQYTFCYTNSLSDDYFLDSDLGYYVFHHTLQLIGGISLQYDHFKNAQPDAFRFSFHPGVTIERGKTFIIVFYTPIDLAGRNAGKFTGFSFAFTLSIH